MQKLEGNTPATAFFNYSNPPKKDSAFIVFDDGQPLRFLSPKDTSISHVYNYPGLFKVALKTRKQIISDTLNILVSTNGWQALASYYQQDFRSRYYPFPMELVSTNEGFHPSRKNLASIGIDTTKILVVQLDNYKVTQVNGDSFTLKTRLKNVNYWPAIRCYSAYIKLVGKNGLIMFKLTNQGCSGFGELTLSEKSEHGSNFDLSGLTLNIKDWNQIEIQNRQKNISLLINDIEVFEDSYQKSIGNIVGISIQFHGSGYVDYFELLDKTNNPIFNKDF